jgi:hypothetical protein
MEINLFQKKPRIRIDKDLDEEIEYFLSNSIAKRVYYTTLTAHPEKSPSPILINAIDISQLRAYKKYFKRNHKGRL